MNYIDLLDEIKAPVLEKEKALYSAKKAFQDIKDDISWYKKYNPAVDKIKAEKAKEKLLVLEKKLNKSEKDIALVEEQLEDVKECVIRWWQKINPVVFVYSLFSTEQKKYKNIEFGNFNCRNHYLTFKPLLI